MSKRILTEDGQFVTFVKPVENKESVTNEKSSTTNIDNDSTSVSPSDNSNTDSDDAVAPLDAAVVSNMSMPELRELAKARGIKTPVGTKKVDLINALVGEQLAANADEASDAL